MAVYKEEKTNTWRAVYRYTDWNGERIGLGCSASGSRENNGKTDAMKYHTGTTAASRPSERRRHGSGNSSTRPVPTWI